MTDKTADILTLQEVKDRPNERLIQLLEEALEGAKSGYIRAGCMMLLTNQGSFVTMHSRGWNDQLQLVGQLEYLKAQLVLDMIDDSMDFGPEDGSDGGW